MYDDRGLAPTTILMHTQKLDRPSVMEKMSKGKEWKGAQFTSGGSTSHFLPSFLWKV